MRKIDVAIGGVGGSGTRVVSELLINSGYFVGNQLNKALDNLLFTLLLRQPEWAKQFPQEHEIEYALDIFISLMSHQSPARLSEDQLRYIQDRPHSKYYNDIEKQRWIDVVNTLLRDSAPVTEYLAARTAWKEPNTHIFLPKIASSLPNLKYVHVIRNGFYMAYSKNQRQVQAWHKLFRLEMPMAGLNPSISLEYWIRANQRAIHFGQEHMAGRFYLLNYDQLCENAHVEVSKLLNFLEVEHTDKRVAFLSSSIKSKPAQALNMQQFSKDQIERAEALAYTD